MRAGTTALQSTLSSVPGVSLPGMKETDFFIEKRNLHRGTAWYDSQFSTAKIRGEVDPNYAKRDVFPGVPERVAARRPDCKIVYIVRDPVDRAMSQYAHSFHAGQDLPSPDDLIGTAQGDHILNTSRYAWQLDEWRTHFPTDQILVVDFDELVSGTDAMTRLIEHIGLPTLQPMPTLVRANDGGSVAKLPRWWLKLRASRLGIALRRAVPRSLAARAKSAAAIGTTRTVPTFGSRARNALAEAVADDTEKLRAMTERQFPTWSV